MVFKKYKAKDRKWSSRVFHKFIYKNGMIVDRKFEAMFVQLLGYTFWLWKTEEIYHDWPCAA